MIFLLAILEPWSERMTLCSWVVGVAGNVVNDILPKKTIAMWTVAMPSVRFTLVTMFVLCPSSEIIK